MGGSASTDCPECKESFIPKPSVAAIAAANRVNAICTYCTAAGHAFNQGYKQKRTFRSNDFSPLCVKGENYANAFVGPSHVITPKQGKPMILGRAQNDVPRGGQGDEGDVEHVGRFWHQQPIGHEGALRHNYAISAGLPMNNTLERRVAMVVPPGIKMLSGVARELKTPVEWLPGGGVQFYIPQAVVTVLWPISQDFMSRPYSQESYAAFIKACEPVFQVQQEWWREFRVQEAESNKQALIHNTLREAKACLAEIQEQLSSASIEPNYIVQLVLQVHRFAVCIKKYTALDQESEVCKELQREVDVWTEVVLRMLNKPGCELDLNRWASVFSVLQNPATGSLVAANADLASFLRAGVDTPVCGKRRTELEGKTFVVHREGSVIVEVRIELDRVVTAHNGDRTYFYNVIISRRTV
jgi:hypothetical protein